MNTATVPIWQSECARPSQRGKLLMLEGVLITGGAMISYWIDFDVSFADSSPVAWQFPIAFQFLFSLIMVSALLFLPESPR